MENSKLKRWLRELFSQHEEELTDIPDMLPQEKTVKQLIDRAVGESAKQSKSDEPEDSETSDSKTCQCPYAVKRNIVKSLEEIRRFAEEHQLAAAVVRALLTLLAEIALGAMKGKVGGKALEALLNAFNYSRHINEAFIRGKNEAIVREYFPERDDIPHLGGMQKEENDDDNNIFSIAREARGKMEN